MYIHICIYTYIYIYIYRYRYRYRYIVICIHTCLCVCVGCGSGILSMFAARAGARLGKTTSQTNITNAVTSFSDGHHITKFSNVTTVFL